MLKIFVLIINLFLLGGTANSSDLENNLKKKAANSLTNFFESNFQNAEFSITSTERNKPDFEILTVQPLTDVGQSVTFMQGSALRHDGDRETINLGLGHRVLSSDESFLYGVNAFYDHEFDYDHGRASLGTEIKSSILEFNSNIYLRNSDSKTGKNNKSEETADGYDYELGTHVPYIPTWKLYIKQFEWDMLGQKDLEGSEYSTELFIPKSGMSLSAGVTDYSNHKDNWFIGLTYNFSKVDTGNPFIQNKAYEKTSMNNQMLAKVRRENKIIKKKGGFSVIASGF